MLDWFGNIIPDGRHAKYSVLVTLFSNISKSMLIGFSQVIIRSDFVFISLSLQTFTSIPLITLDSDSEDPIRWKLFLSQIHSLSQLVILFIEIILKMTLDKHCLRHMFRIGLRLHDLFHLFMNWILLYFSKSVISRINWPIVWSLLLLSRIVVLMRFEIHLSHLLSFRHILSRVDSLFCSVFVVLCG